MNTITNPVRIGRKMKPTRKHRPAVWECMLGTVYAMDDAGKIRYFDYDWAGALAWAGIDLTADGVSQDRDPRHFKAAVGSGDWQGWGTGQLVLYVRQA